MNSEEMETRTIILAGEEFVVELAVSDKGKWQGLSDRKKIGRNEGMFFVWQDEAQRRFSMRRMNFSIDIIFLDRQGSLINMFLDAPPWTSETGVWYFSAKPAQYVLEIPGGTVDRLFLSASDQLAVDVATLRLN